MAAPPHTVALTASGLPYKALFPLIQNTYPPWCAIRFGFGFSSSFALMCARLTIPVFRGAAILHPARRPPRCHNPPD